MALRKPLVVGAAGIASELPNGDQIAGLVVGLTYLVVSATNEVSTTSTTMSLINSMQHVTPPAGTYLAIFNANVYASRGATDSYGKFQIFVGGTAQANSLRELRLLVQLLLGVIGNTSIKGSGGTIIVPVTVDGTQNVEVRFASDAAAVTTYAKERNFILVRIA